MCDYVPKKYSIPKTAYHRAIWLIRDMDRIQNAADSLIMVCHGDYAVGNNHAHSDPVFRAVKQRERYLKDIDIVKSALEVIPQEYRTGVLQSITDRKPYPVDASRSTYGYWKTKLIQEVALRAGYIDEFST